MEEEDKKKLRVLNIIIAIVFLSFFITTISIYISDIINFPVNNPGITPVKWFIDSDLNFPLSQKGLLMLICEIFVAISILVCIFTLLKINIKRKEKKVRYYITMMFYSLLLFTSARILELYYIPSDSDLYGFHYFSQFYLVFDAVGFSLFLIFTVEIFLAEEIRKSKLLPKLATIFGTTTVLLGIVALLSYLWIPEVSSILTILIIVVMLCLVILSLIGITVVYKILKLRSRVKVKRKELLLIALQLIFLILITYTIVVTIVSFYIMDDPITSYIFRIIKIILHIINAYIIYLVIYKSSNQ